MAARAYEDEAVDYETCRGVCNCRLACGALLGRLPRSKVALALKLWRTRTSLCATGIQDDSGCFVSTGLAAKRAASVFVEARPGATIHTPYARAKRYMEQPTNRLNNIGFRVARTL